MGGSPAAQVVLELTVAENGLERLLLLSAEITDTNTRANPSYDETQLTQAPRSRVTTIRMGSDDPRAALPGNLS